MITKMHADQRDLVYLAAATVKMRRAAGRVPTADLPALHATQAQVKAEARRFNVVDNARRWGKTELAKNLLCETALEGFPAAYFSVSYRNLVETWDGLKVALRQHTARVRESIHRLDLWSGGSVSCWSMEAPIAVRGRKFKRVVIDEAAHDPHLENTWLYVVRPTLTDYEGDAWFMSTPRGFNYFHTLWKRAEHPDEWPDWASWQMPTSANPVIPAIEIERLRGELPPEVFAQEYEAQFTSDATRHFHPIWWLGDANRYDPLALVETPTRVQVRGIFWDTALKDKQENAYSAAVVVEVLGDDRLAVREVWRGRPQFPDLVAETERIAERWNFDGKLRHVVVEDKVSGTSLVQTLAAQAPSWLRPLVQPFAVTGAKPERWGKAAVWCSKGAVLLPTPSPAAPWLPGFEEELFGTPNAPFLDQADAFSMGVVYFENYLSRWDAARRGEGVAA